MMHVHFLWEGKRRGLNKGLRLAVREAKRQGFSAALILPSDLPVVTADEITGLLQLTENYSIALTPSKEGSGTNALLMRPPGAISPAFGKSSFRRHLAIAKRAGISPRVVKSKGIAWDVDNPEDLAALRSLPLRNQTGRFLRTMEFACPRA